MLQQIVIPSLSEIDAAADEFLRRIGDRRLIAFYAPMGAGKTTFTTALCRRLGVRADAVSSPTFAIVNEYRTASGEPVYHFDFYRLKTPAEAYDIGCMDYFYSGSYCFTEWTENIESILPDHYLRIDIVEESQRRTLTATLVEG